MAKKAYIIKSMITNKEYGPIFVTSDFPGREHWEVDINYSDAVEAIAGMLLWRKNEAVSLGETKFSQIGNKVSISHGEWATKPITEDEDMEKFTNVNLDEMYPEKLSVTFRNNKIWFCDTDGSCEGRPEFRW